MSLAVNSAVSRNCAGMLGIQTLVVVGAVRDGRPGFVILADRANGETGDFAGGEQLQDHKNCPAPDR
ncbi:MAG: CDP-diacylglycerol diphosphatase [Mycobacterium sp.]